MDPPKPSHEAINESAAPLTNADLSIDPSLWIPARLKRIKLMSANTKCTVYSNAEINSLKMKMEKAFDKILESHQESEGISPNETKPLLKQPLIKNIHVSAETEEINVESSLTAPNLFEINDSESTLQISIDTQYLSDVKSNTFRRKSLPRNRPMT